ncbi:hypothetical protein COX86_02055 [Candidatus Micrarchaeota archaeon CG_4_10_14_0_2_um_filter_60_11]|nr:MAG: hypothetical protein AUJ16_03790 [Candidatus Micrarchaeota archaeon CG1_02_60_51]PIN96027.1 MAG: hypothetical protein COU39_02945 [Candidatus Micrarchaeota archaeon CG10_big_fil_rev_8_21_14_0_10_60_32]PIO02390.1 MAG: hypothetical protein COT58_00405 [Candidatus Micrarchaeota archaeon CG09_land_8_20_14_0_10_60_16]PIZ90984.1 MAG: hypothetical protein COX86_02055 [Candidatus Micrarchaeota archaeon CG_4_10_14_0_2_um_filter_60_11]
MKAVVLAGGSGKRVFPLAVNKPKPMFKILEKPLMQRVLESLRGGGIREIVAVIGHNAEQISDYFGNGSKFGVKIEYAYQDKALGMAHALQCAESRLNGKFAVFNADDIFDASLVKQLVQKSKKAEAVLAAQQVEETWKYGIIALDGDSVTKIVEKPAAGEEPSNNAVVGAYALTEGIFDYCRKRPVGDAQFEEALQAMIDDGRRVKAVGYKGFFGSYKYPWDLFRLNEHFLDSQKARIAKTAKISKRAVVKGKQVFIGENVRVFEGAIIEGPCFIGDGAVIGNNALVRGYASIGAGSVIGYSSEVKHSIIGDNCWTHSSYVGDSIIGDNCSLGAGTVTANYRFDEGKIKVNIHGKGRIETPLDKLGVIMADDCKTGSNSTLLPGVKVGPHSIVGPGVLLSGDLEPNKIVLVKKQTVEVVDNRIQLDPEKAAKLKERLLRYSH